MATRSDQIRERIFQILDRIVYKNKSRVQADILDVCTQCPSLSPAQDSFFHPDGSEQRMILLQGTIPITYSSSTYNIPVKVWIVQDYPFSPPMAYVTPNQDMVLQLRHPHMDNNGRCCHSYLSSGWSPSENNLAGLVTVLISVFSQNPPVYAKVAQQQQQQQQPRPSVGGYGTQAPVGYNPQPVQPPYYNNNAGGYGTGYNYGGVAQPQPQLPYTYGTNPAYPTGASTAATQPRHSPPIGWDNRNGTTPAVNNNSNMTPNAANMNINNNVNNNNNNNVQPPPGYPGTNPAAVQGMLGAMKINPQPQHVEVDRRQQMINLISNRLQRKIDEYTANCQQQLQALTESQQSLTVNNNKLEGSLVQLRTQKVKLENEITLKNNELGKLEKWLHEHPEDDIVDPVALATPKDTMTKQLFDARAEIDAIEDTLVVLTDCTSKNPSKIAFPDYLQQYRALSRQLFFKRLLVEKITTKRKDLGLD